MSKKLAFMLDSHLRSSNPISRIDNYSEAILKKIEYVCQNNDLIVFCGDIFNSHQINTSIVNKLLKLLTNFESIGKTIKIIPGNHDIIGRNYDSIWDTSLGTICIGRNWLIRETLYYNKFSITPLFFDKEGNPNFSKPCNEHCNILIGHAYYNHPEFNDKWNIDEEFLKNTKFDYCILGHDHQEYQPEVIDNGNACVLLRSGSISRSTIDDKNRIPKYVQIILHDNSTIQESYQEIPCESRNKVFKDNKDVSKELKKYREDIQSIIGMLQVDSSKVFNLEEALRGLETPEKYIQLIQEVLNE